MTGPAWLPPFLLILASQHSQSSAQTTAACDDLDSDELLSLLKEEGSFNPRFQALSIEDAVAQFPDPTTFDESEPQPTDANDRETCEQRMELKAAKFKGIGIAFDNGWEWEEKVRRECQGMEDGEPTTTTDPPTTDNPLPKHLREVLSKQAAEKLKKAVANRPPIRRNKREDGQSIGEAHVISCRHPNEQDESGLVRMCGLCQAILKLPLNYFPRFVNQAICCPQDRCPSSPVCLRGHGLCKQKFTVLDVLKNEGTERCPEWHPVSLRIPVCCDCFLMHSSPLVQIIKSS